MRSLYDISWQVDEPTYRADSALSQSAIAKYKREGFTGLPHLFDKISTPSLTFGSAVDCLITDSEEEFHKRFYITDVKTTESGEIICNNLINYCKENSKPIPQSLTMYPEDILNKIAKESGFWQADKWDKIRAKKALEIENIEEFYNDIYNSEEKQIISNETYRQVLKSVVILKTSDATKFWFAPNNPFNTSFERFYQLKFKTTLYDVPLRGMLDLVCVNHKTKMIHPVDLKTSSHTEWDFGKSFLEWDYYIQAIIYTALLEDALSKDPYYKDFKVDNYRFIVVNRNTLTPLVWEFEDSHKREDLFYGRNNQIKLRNPFTLAQELYYYLTHQCSVPTTINQTEKNSLTKILKEL